MVSLLAKRLRCGGGILKWTTVGTLPIPQKTSWGTIGTLPTPPISKWGTLGTLPTPPQIEMGHPRNTSNAPKHNKYILLTKTKHNYEFGNYFSY